MMAAMAQQDCGQCGYDCHNYSEAIANKSEARLNLCVPGGKETARMLKSLYEDIDKVPAAPSSAPAAAPAAPAAGGAGRSRDNPIAATFLSRRLLNKKGSEKETWHIEFDLSGCGLDYVVGDPSAFCAQRCRAGGPDHRAARRLPHHQGERQDAARGPDRRRLAVAGAGSAVRTDLLHHRRRQREKARALAQGEDPDGDAATLM